VPLNRINEGQTAPSPIHPDRRLCEHVALHLPVSELTGPDMLVKAAFTNSMEFWKQPP
jgi:hypothetical protein